jgi:hypothetical protein
VPRRHRARSVSHLALVSREPSTAHASTRAMILAKTLFTVGVLVASLASCGPMQVGGYRVHSERARLSSLESYPHVAYENREAYLLGSNWYYLDPTYGLVVFDEEPPELRSFRERSYAAEAARTADARRRSEGGDGGDSERVLMR